MLNLFFFSLFNIFFLSFSFKCFASCCSELQDKGKVQQLIQSLDLKLKSSRRQAVWSHKQKSVKVMSLKMQIGDIKLLTHLGFLTIDLDLHKQKPWSTSAKVFISASLVHMLSWWSLQLVVDSRISTRIAFVSSKSCLEVLFAGINPLTILFSSGWEHS